MKIITTVKGSFIFVEVPNNEYRRRYGVFCKDEDIKWQISYLGLNGEDSSRPFLNFNADGNVIYNVRLTENKEDTFVIIAQTKYITEQQSKDIVEYVERVNGSSYTARVENDYYHGTAIQALQSLIKANGLDISKNYIIVKHENNNNG